MLDFILKYFEVEDKEKVEIEEEVQRIGLKNFTDIYLLVCCYRNENMIDRFFIIDNYKNYMKAS